MLWVFSSTCVGNFELSTLFCDGCSSMSQSRHLTHLRTDISWLSFLLQATFLLVLRVTTGDDAVTCLSSASPPRLLPRQGRDSKRNGRWRAPAKSNFRVSVHLTFEVAPLGIAGPETKLEVSVGGDSWRMWCRDRKNLGPMDSHRGHNDVLTRARSYVCSYSRSFHGLRPPCLIPRLFLINMLRLLCGKTFNCPAWHRI